MYYPSYREVWTRLHGFDTMWEGQEMYSDSAQSHCSNLILRHISASSISLIRHISGYPPWMHDPGLLDTSKGIPQSRALLLSPLLSNSNDNSLSYTLQPFCCISQSCCITPSDAVYPTLLHWQFYYYIGHSYIRQPLLQSFLLVVQVRDRVANCYNPAMPWLLGYFHMGYREYIVILFKTHYSYAALSDFQ